MHRNAASKRKKIVTASIAGLLTVAIVGGTLWSNTEPVMARPSLPGIEDIVNNNSNTKPFYILEIVDKVEDARIGYLVGGEEPGDAANADGLSDTAYNAERNDRYMTAGHDTKGFPAYTELENKAFTYTDPTWYDEPQANGRTYNAYGRFTENTADTGRYDFIDDKTSYVALGQAIDHDNDATTPDYTPTIQDVVNRESYTDQTGKFYMDYVDYDPAETDATVDASADGGRYRIDALTEYTAADMGKRPFLTYTDASSTPYYNDHVYVIGKTFATKKEDPDTTVAGDEYYILDPDYSTPEDGDIVYELTGANMQYFGVFRNYDGGDLEFYKYDSTKTSNYLNATLDAPTQTGVPVEETAYDPGTDNSFTKCISTSLSGNDKFVTVRYAEFGETSNTKYYIDTVVKDDANGQYIMTTSDKLPVNIADGDPGDYGIVDESGDTPPWYHKWYFKLGGKDPFQYNAAKTGKYDFEHDFTAEIVKTAYYTGGYVNNEWFKKEVLDVDPAKLDSVFVDVITKTPDQVTPEDIQNAGLIYITSGDYDSYGDVAGHDFSFAAAKELITQVDKNKKAVVIDSDALTNLDYAGNYWDTTKNYTNLWHAFYILMLDDMDGISSNYINAAGDNWTTLQASEYGLHNNIAGATVFSHVADSVFVNHVKTGTTPAVAADFSTAFGSTDEFAFTYNVGGQRVTLNYDGFVPVKEDIDLEKFYLSVANKDVSTFNDVICKATAIRYILNYGNRRVVAKNAIRVLDIEPYYSREIENPNGTSSAATVLRNVYYRAENKNVNVENIDSIRDIITKNWMTTNLVLDNSKSINITGIGTKEFIGKIEDLNENYDMIYIGMDTAYMNTSIDKRNNKYYKSKDVVSNDGKHYVYRHLGDTISTSGMDGGDVQNVHMSGNDITPDKLRELQNYVKAGYAVLLSDEFFTYASNGSISGIDKNRVDENSYIYDFVNWCLTEKDTSGALSYMYKNVNITRNVEKNAGVATSNGQSMETNLETFVSYLNLSKLEVEVIEHPLLYNQYEDLKDANGNIITTANEHNYLKMNSSGIYTLDFKVKLSNDAATDTTNTSYNCKMYIDHDGDGRFEPVEELTGLDIYNETSNEGEYVSDGKFHLHTGATYTISRRVPEGYVGLISWKLVFVENRPGDDENIRVAVQDYSAINDLTKRPIIKVLQLTSGTNGKGLWVVDNTKPEPTLDLRDDPTLQGYYNQVIDFEISVDKAPVGDLIDRKGIFTGQDRLSKLLDYDMLVLGFCDGYNFVWRGNNTNDEDAMMALRQYILSGRSVLFTHDLTSTRVWDSSGGKEWGYLADKYLTDVQGMDRFHHVEPQLQNDRMTYLGQELTEYVSSYESKATVTGNDIWGFSDSSLQRYNDSPYGEIAAIRNIGSSREMNSVARVNRGQITEYPFRIGDMTQDQDTGLWSASEFITVATTHHQYMQLNLETSYIDENYDDDIVVWYTLTAKKDSNLPYFKLNYNDVRNNYYIFNKGNITYTGAGHSYIGDNSQSGNAEKKLFVNTLVAAYNAGKHAPYASYKQNSSPNSKDVSSLYIPYDLALATDSDLGEGVNDSNGFVEPTVTTYFKTINNNLQDNLKPLNAKYYIEVPSGGAGIVKIGNKYFKEITPTYFKDCTDGIEYTTNAADAASHLTNGKMYEIRFNVSSLMNGNTFENRRNAVIYTRMSADTTLEEMSNTAELMVLPGVDSLEPLNINFTELYDLR